MLIPELESAWRATTKVLLGREIPNLLDYEDYLKRYTDPIEKRTSAISKKEVIISSNRIPSNAPVIGHDEAEYYAKLAAILSIDLRAPLHSSRCSGQFALRYLLERGHVQPRASQDSPYCYHRGYYCRSGLSVVWTIYSECAEYFCWLFCYCWRPYPSSALY